MNEKELNKLVKEHYGFTIEELDNDVAYWCFRCSELQQKNKELHNKIDKVIKRIELLGKFDGEHCTRNFKMMSADFNYLLKILKGGDVDEC